MRGATLKQLRAFCAAARHRSFARAAEELHLTPPAITMQIKDHALFRQQCYIDGTWIDAPGGATIDVSNPASGAKLGTVPSLGAAGAEAAVAAAHTAFPSWAAKTAKERAALLRRWYELIVASADDIGTMMTAEQGKPLAEARAEVTYAAAFVEWFGYVLGWQNAEVFGAYFGAML